MPETTKAQTLYGHGIAPIMGGLGFGEHTYSYKTDAGTTIVPAIAAVRGSLAFEGRNPYESPVWGVGNGFAVPHVWPGTFPTYRRMLGHPTIALAVATIIGPIMAAGCSIESMDGAQDGARELIEDNLMPQRNRMVRELLRAFVFGFQAAELVWDTGDDGRTILAKFKPLLPDWTTFKSDEHGNLTNVVNGGVDLTMDRAIVFTYDGEGDSPWGRGRLENLRRTWANYLAKEDQLFRMGGKASGISVHVGYPPDQDTVEAIKARGGMTNAEKATQIARDLSAGKSVVHPILGTLAIDDVADIVAISKGTLWPITLLDLGNVAPSQAAMLEDLKYLDQLLCRGVLRSERSVIEAQGGGTRAESADHTANISDTDCDMLHEAIVDAINKQIVDRLLVENFGDDARGSVKFVANQIVDESRAVMLKMLDAWLNDPMAFGELLSRADKNLLVNRLGIKLNKDAAEWPDDMPTGGGGMEDPAGDPRDEDGKDSEPA